MQNAGRNLKTEWRQGIKKGHIVEKAKETSSDTGMHNRVITCMNNGCFLECRDTPTSHCVAW